MKTIPLTKGQIVLVDDIDFNNLRRWKWHAMFQKHRNKYVVARRQRGDMILMSRQIMGLEVGDKRQVDHRNRDTLDCCRNNLRVCTCSQNLMNKPCRGGTSQYKGVSWRKSRDKWRAQININSKKTEIGCFCSEIEAARAYDKAAKQHYGEFACLNFPEII